MKKKISRHTLHSCVSDSKSHNIDRTMWNNFQFALLRILFFDFLQWATVAVKSWLFKPSPSNFTLTSLSQIDGDNLDLSLVTTLFCTEKVLSQSLVCKGKVRAM